ncbi:glutamate racemase, partial [Aliarcobacter butzleri]
EDITLSQTGEAIAKGLLSLSEAKGHKNNGDIKVTVIHTGLIILDMIENTLENKNTEVRKCEI